MKYFSKKSIVSVSTLLVAIVAGGWMYFGGDKTTSPDFVVIERRDLVQEVNVAGRVKPADDVDLAFEKSGQVNKVYIQVGDEVKTGQLLVELKNADIAAQVSQAEASIASAKAQSNQYQAGLEMQQAKLAELQQGARPEEIQVQEVKVANAKTALNDAKQNLIDKLQDAYTKSDDAVRNKVDQFFSNPRTANPQIVFFVIDSQLENNLEQERVGIEDTLVKWKLSLDNLSSISDLTFSIDEAKNHLNQVKLFLDKAGLAINGASPGSSLSQTTIDSWKLDVATARTNVNTAVANLTGAEEKLSTAESSLALAEQELTLKKAGTIAEQIAAQKAQVKQAQANITSQQARVKEAEANAQYYRAQLDKTILRAPMLGVVTKQDARAGEIISANTVIVSIISSGGSNKDGSAFGWEAEANVPEADIAKIKIGDTARVALDAYGSDVLFHAKVISLDPAEVIVDGVATYKTTLRFSENDSRIKSGMTADIDIATAKRENVLAIPQRVVFTKSNEKFVKIFTDGKIEEVKVKTGLKGSDGNIEISDGLKEGDQVIVL